MDHTSTALGTKIKKKKTFIKEGHAISVRVILLHHYLMTIYLAPLTLIARHIKIKIKKKTSARKKMSIRRKKMYRNHKTCTVEELNGFINYEQAKLELLNEFVISLFFELGYSLCKGLVDLLEYF